MFFCEQYIFEKSPFGLQGMEKLILFMVLLNAALLSGQTYLHLFLLCFIVGSFLAYGMQVRKLICLLALPLGFVILGSISIAFTLHANPNTSLFCWEIKNICIGIEEAGLNKATALFCKAMAAVMALNYLIFSCSLSEINEMGRKLRVPLILRELFVLTYRYISLLFGFTTQVHIAQRNRLGYVNRKQSILSLAMLFSSVFIKSLQYSQCNLEALQSRGYKGEFYFQNQNKPIRLRQIVAILIFTLFLVTINCLSFVELVYKIIDFPASIQPVIKTARLFVARSLDFFELPPDLSGG